jgi:pyruvate dehydrogenase E1 component beta subunit
MEAWYAHVPGLKVVVPSTPYDAKGLLISSIYDDNPVVFMEQKVLYRRKGPVPEETYEIPLSQSEVKREGGDLTIVTYGRMLPMCMEVAEEVSDSQGIEVEVVDPRTLRPLDIEPIVKSAAKTGRVLIVHEAVQFGGFGGELAAQIADSEAFYYLDAPIKRLGGADAPIPYNPNLEKHAVPTPEAVKAAIGELLD